MKIKSWHRLDEMDDDDCKIYYGVVGSNNSKKEWK
jgi:hypothetical protein